MRKLCYALLSFLILVSCSTQYYVEGKSTVQSMDGKKLYLKVYADGDLKDIDSCEVIHGMFQFTGQLDSAVMVNLFMDDEGLMPLVLEENEIQVHIDKAQQYVTGSPLNDTLYNFIREKSRLDNLMAELPHKESRMIMDGVSEDVIMLRLNDEAQRLAAEQDRLITRFITSNFDNVLGSGVFMILLAEAIGGQSVAIACWFGIFVMSNVIYFMLSEEPGLRRRFGSEYEEYYP